MQKNTESPAVLFLTHSGQLGGAEISLIDLVTPYSKNGTCVVFQSGPLADRLRSATGITVQQLDVDLSYIHRESEPATLATSTYDVLKLSAKLGRLAKDFDLIYANTLKASVIGSLAGLWSGRPVIIHLRDILSYQHFSHINRIVFTLTARYLASAVVANSHATIKAYLVAGGHSSKVRVIYPGFDHLRFTRTNKDTIENLRQDLGIPENAVIIGCFSRISRWKGQDVLMKAFAQQHPTTMLLLVGAPLFGENEFLGELELLSHQLQISDRVIFAGFKDNPEALLSMCDIVVHPSSSPEPFGRAVVEAQLSGKLVIGTDMGGIREIIEHGKTGLLVPIGDIQALSTTLTSVLADSKIRIEIGLAARAFASEQFSLSAAHEATRLLISDVLRGR
jgi:glycosyltransferase involved in cell wall biosynthesis